MRSKPNRTLTLRLKHILSIMINVIVPKLLIEHAGEIWKVSTKFVKQLETVQMTAAKKALRCSNTTSNKQNWEITHVIPIESEKFDMAIESKERAKKKFVSNS